MTNTYEEFTLRVDNGPDLRFKGELIASVYSSGNPADKARYSGSADQWAEMMLYRTQGGKFVCHRIERSDKRGQHDRFKAEVCDTKEAVIAFFGHRWLAKELYDEAGISDAEVIE